MKRLFHFLSLSFIFMLSSMAVCGCVPAQTPLYYFHAGLSTYHELLDDVLGKRSEVDLFSSAADSSAPVSSVTETISCAPLYADYSYYLPSLADDEAANFQALYTGIQGFQSTISLPVAVSSDNVSDLMHLLTNECPELMQLSSRWVEHSNLLGLVVSVSPEYTISKETFDAQTSAVNTLIQSWQTTLSGQSAYQAELTIYNYIIENCVYSTQADNCQSAYGALIDGQAKCDGRAKALVWGLRSLGIKSSVITGNTHAWVIAHIGDYDYNVDPTYDDNENDGIQQPLCYAYFNIPESAISSDPYPADDFYQRRGYPSTVRWDFNFHVQAGLWIYADDPSSSDPASGTALDRARALFVAQAESIWEGGGEGLVMIRFENASDYADAAASYNDWIQSFINMHAAGCNIVNYDFSNQQLLAVRLSFY